jgi:ABC-type Fe3+-hydroxamate transport system substrate-binding protein
MPSFTDQLGRVITLEHPPSRIISLVPSQTELLYTLDAPVVGITRFCVHPDSWFREKPRVGGTKDILPEKIDALHPDLIIANKEENDRDQIESLAARYPVWVSDIKTLPDALAMIRAVGELVSRSQEALVLATAIEKAFSDLAFVHPGIAPPVIPRSGPSRQLHTPTPSRGTAYFIWRKPWMVAAGGTFIDDMLQRCGLSNIFGCRDRYPIIDLASLGEAGCDLVLLSSEPYPFREKHIVEIQTLLPHVKIRLVDGQLFSWYGSRLLQAPAYFAATF